MDDYLITNAGETDVEAIKLLEIACGLSPWTVQDYRDEQGRADSVMLKVESSDGELAGFLIGRAAEGGEAEIYNIGIDATHRRKGIAGSLLDRFCKTCLGRGISMVWLEVRTTNKTAISFYRSRGFVTRGIRPGFYSNPTEDAELMSLKLP